MDIFVFIFIQEVTQIYFYSYALQNSILVTHCPQTAYFIQKPFLKYKAALYKFTMKQQSVGNRKEC